MPVLNKNVGIGGLDVGLCLIMDEGSGLLELDTNEFGLIETTLRFAIFSTQAGGKIPFRGMPCPSFVGGNDATTAILDGLAFMGAQTSKRISNGGGDGIDIFEILCQGALFTTQGGLIQQRIRSIDILNRGAGYLSPPRVNVSGFEIEPASIATGLEADTIVDPTLGAGVNYQVGDELTVVGGQSVLVAKLLVDTVDGSGHITSGHISERGAYSVIPQPGSNFSGGHGTGAKGTLTWRVGYVVVFDGGLYAGGIPTVSLSGGNPATPARLGVPNMEVIPVPGADITPPFSPVSTTKDSVDFVMYNAPGVGDLSSRLVSTQDLGAVLYFTHTDGTIRLTSSGNATFPDIDGKVVSVGDRILLVAMANPAYNGLYKLISRGQGGLFGGQPWILTRVTAMDTAAEITTTVFVHVSDGSNNRNTRWHCTAAITNLGTDPIVFALVTGGAQPTATYQVTVEYESIDLHFEYVSKNRLQEPRFIRDQYSIDGDGLIVIDPFTGDKMKLSIDSSTAQAAIVNADTGEVTFSQVKQNVEEAFWHSSVRYKGTSSRFEQTPAGLYWHVLETTTIKIDPIA